MTHAFPNPLLKQFEKISSGGQQKAHNLISSGVSMSIHEFYGDKSDLTNALLKMRYVYGNREIAQEFANAENGELIEFSKGKNLITQGESKTDVFFILSGSVSIHKNGKQIGQGEQFGVYGANAAISLQKRNATVKAENIVCAWKIPRKSFKQTADKFPTIWEDVSVETTTRAASASDNDSAHERPRIFIISCGDHRNLIRDICGQSDLEDYDVSTWVDAETFIAGNSTLKDIERAIDGCDYLVALALGVDKTEDSDEHIFLAPRGNVILEIGIAIGKIGRQRTIVFTDDLKNLPSDYRGITIKLFNRSNSNPALDAARKIRSHIKIVEMQSSQ